MSSIDIPSGSNRLILGDNLEIMKTLDAESVDLIYLDPPFFSNRNYEVIWGDAGEIRSFKDRWSGGMSHYVAWLKERIELMHRLLKKTGSFFLHCDWHANAYIRVEVLDKIFGDKNFRNEIIWRYSSGGASKKFFSRNHDMIYFYTKSAKYTFKPEEIRVPRTEEVIRRINSGTKNATRAESLDKLPEDIFDIQYINAMAKERIGYPTQKPEALLERIIKCASNEGDLILDPFMGGGTTMAVADKLNRRWIGIDKSVMAVKVTEERLQKQNGKYECIIAQSLKYNKKAS
jgi:DNA modification methylase